MLRPMRLLLCASAAALILGVAPTANFAFIAPAHAQADIAITASIAPPPIPVYSQPPIPGPGYLWIPGYWTWDGTEYYWVPGYWAMSPAVDLLWTPGYWAWDDANNDYVFYSGYWAPTVGYYGGIDYGFGYTGVGYHGGYWRDHHFYYNRAVNNFGNAHIATVFNAPVPAPVTPTRVSYHGGHGGTTVGPTPAELAVAHAHRMAATAEQIRHQTEARGIASLRYNENHGRPPIAATERANQFHGAHVAAVAGAGAAAGAALAVHAGALQGRSELAHGAQARAGGHPGVPVHAQRFAHAAPQRFAHAAPQHFAHAAPQRFAHAAPHAAPQRFAHAAPAMHAPAFHPNFAARAPAHFAAAPHFGGGAPHFGGGAPHFGGGAPHFGGGAPHFAGGAPHFGGGAPHFAGGGMHFGGAPHFAGGGPRRP